jgi:hypothetical protein
MEAIDGSLLLCITPSESASGATENLEEPPLMKLDKLLSQHKSTLIKRWFDEVVRSYPVDTARFLKQQKDPFANPVGNTTLKGLEALFDVLTTGLDREAVNSFLDPIIRIRALQDFTPSQAVSFILYLKQAIRETLNKEFQDPEVLAAFLNIESKIDDLCMAAFDIYVQCREKLYQIQANEMRNTTFRAFQRAGLVKDVPDEEAPELRLITPRS